MTVLCPFIAYALPPYTNILLSKKKAAAPRGIAREHLISFGIVAHFAESLLLSSNQAYTFIRARWGWIGYAIIIGSEEPAKIF